MAKRTSRAAQSVRSFESKIEPLFGAETGRGRGWHPVAPEAEDEHRDQSYVRKVRPQSDNQRALMQAIDTHNLCVALGPAGTGKTYLAVTAAVEALEGCWENANLAAGPGGVPPPAALIVKPVLVAGVRPGVAADRV